MIPNQSTAEFTVLEIHTVCISVGEVTPMFAALTIASVNMLMELAERHTLQMTAQKPTHFFFGSASIVEFDTAVKTRTAFVHESL